MKLANGLSSITSVSVDEAQGRLHAYTSFDLPTTVAGYSTIESLGILGGYSVFHGPNSLGSAAVPVTFEMSIHGAFGPVSANPATVTLFGELDLQIANTFAGGAVEADISMLSLGRNSGAVTVTQKKTQQINNGPAVDFAGAAPTVLSTAENNLQGVVRVTTLIKPGQYVSVSNGLGALAMPAYTLLPTLPIQFVSLPSSGSVDASNTANVRIYVPYGYGFDTSGPSLFSTTVTSVPEPAQGLLLVAGLAALCLRVRRAHPLR